MTTIAVDLAKSVFQLAIADAQGKIVAHRRLSRSQFERFWGQQPTARVVMEACSGAHHWARMLLGLGFEVVLLPPAYVSPYRQRNKTDQADAEALLQALRDPRIQPVTIKSPEQQALTALHRVRSQWVGTRTARINALRGLLLEFGIALPTGTRRLALSLTHALDSARDRLPSHLLHAVQSLWSEVQDLTRRIREVEEELERVSKTNHDIRRLREIPGIGLLTATALYASIGDIHAFPSGRHFASWLGLTPRENSSGHARRLGRISKQGDTYLRTLLTHGARAALHAAQRKANAGRSLSYLEAWAVQKAIEQHPNRAVSALANKLARAVWAVWHHDRAYDGNHALAQAA